jgi:hypothetical protein
MQVGWLEILFLMLLLQAPSSSLNANHLRITGTAVDAVGGAPVKEASVFLTREQTTVSVLTQQDGRFAFENLEPGKYVLSASGKGYQLQAFDEHENFATAIVAGADQNTENLLFRLTPAASMSGQVTDEFSEAVRGAQVMLFWEGITNGRHAVQMRNQASTDDQGRYRLVGLQPGRYYLAVHAQPWYAQHNALRSSDARSDVSPGFHAATEQNANLDVVYPLTYYPRETDVARAGAISLHPGERVTADFELQPVPSLHLRFPVRGTDLNQIPGMQVMQQIFGQSIPTDSQIISRDTDSIEVAGIPPGHLVVRLDMNADPANGRGMRSMQQEIDATRDGTVNLTETSDWVAVSGKVEIAGSVGLPDSAGIMLRSVETGSDYFANISKEGKNAFQIADVKPGGYNVFLGNVPDFYVDKVQAVGAAVSGNNVTIGTAPQVRLAVSISQAWDAWTAWHCATPSQ